MASCSLGRIWPEGHPGRREPLAGAVLACCGSRRVGYAGCGESFTAGRELALLGDSNVMDYWDRNTCILFGDGAGAAVFEVSTDGDGMLGAELGADGPAGSTMVFESLGFTQMSWLSPWGTRTKSKVFPPSVDFMKGEVRT